MGFRNIALGATGNAAKHLTRADDFLLRDGERDHRGELVNRAPRFGDALHELALAQEDIAGAMATLIEQLPGDF